MVVLEQPPAAMGGRLDTRNLWREPNVSLQPRDDLFGDVGSPGGDGQPHQRRAQVPVPVADLVVDVVAPDAQEDLQGFEVVSVGFHDGGGGDRDDLTAVDGVLEQRLVVEPGQGGLGGQSVTA